METTNTDQYPESLVVMSPGLPVSICKVAELDRIARVNRDGWRVYARGYEFNPDRMVTRRRFTRRKDAVEWCRLMDLAWAFA